MRSLGGSLATLVNKAPVPYVSRGVHQIPLASGQLGMASSTPETQMRAMGANGTLFAIVSRLATATASAKWKLWRKAASGKDDDRVEVTRHAALDRWRKPNPFMHQRLFVETFQQHLDLVGEADWLVSTMGTNTMPLELWPVRPDKIEVVPHPEDFIECYQYLSPDGERIRLERNELIMLKMPNPMDIYRGLGPVQAILVDLDSARYSAEWNRNFFLNSAEPGGIIEYEEELSDDDFKQAADRWREQHRGVGNAHRVAIIERGKWVERKITQRDMQFAELRDVSRDTIREAFGFPKPLLGAVDDVNRANAEAAEVVFARWLVKDRLDRIKDALNETFLPMYGATATGLEFDYENPVPDDRAADALELTAKAGALKVFVELGAVWESACEALKLPEMDFEKPEPPPAPTFGGAPGGPPTPPDAAPPKVAKPKPKPKALAYAWGEHVHNAADDAAQINLERMQVAWERALAALLGKWTAIRSAQIDTLSEQIADAINDGDTARLTRLDASSPDAAALLADAMQMVANGAALHVVAEAKAQGVTLSPAQPPLQPMVDHAELVVTMLGNAMALTAGREALRIRRSVTRSQVVNVSSGSAAAAMVAKFLKAQSDQGVRTELGAALTQAQNTGRFETLLSGPIAALYASEQNDKNTCIPCSEVDGRWLGNSDGVDMDELNKTYPNSGYVGCLGRDRCRGSVVGVWRKGTE